MPSQIPPPNQTGQVGQGPATDPVRGPIYQRIVELLFRSNRLMMGFDNPALQRLHDDLLAMKELMQDEQWWMKWESRSVAWISVASLSLSLLGAMIPNTPGAAAAAPAMDPRLTANAGLFDYVTQSMGWLSGRVQDREFLSGACKASGTFMTNMTGPAQLACQGPRSEAQFKRSLAERLTRETDGLRSTCASEVQRTQDAISRLAQAKASGGA